MIVLCIDLDGTLVRTDTARDAAIQMFKRNPLLVFLFPFWLLGGLAAMKRQIAKRVTIDPSQLPYNKALVEWIKDEKAKGRKVVLVTATDQAFAQTVADHVGLFDEVMASDGKTNLRAANKREALTKRFGVKQYDYAGNDTPDLAVWEGVNKAIVVNPSKPSLIDRCRRIAEIDRIFP
mgnify:FL=1|tara:strand:+ start:18103 stop:18636 length:534 start_codon:yes stop_codon:yes gene_type:complete